MKRFLLSSLLVLSMGLAAYGYENDGNVFVPSVGTWDLVQLDTTDGLFVNNGTFFVDTTLIQGPGIAAPVLYETSDTLNVTNNGIMGSTPGFDFEHFPSSVGQPEPLENFVNNNTGAGGGAIYATNTGFFLIDGSITTAIVPAEPATVKIRAKHVVNTGLIQMDNLGLIDIAGDNLDLSRGQLIMQGGFNGNFGINPIDFGYGLFGDTNLQPWQPDIDLTPNQALSSVFFSMVSGFAEQMFLTNATFYIENPAPPIVNSNAVWRIVYIQDNSPSSVAKNVYFGTDQSGATGGGFFHIEWVGPYRDPVSGQNRTNYFYLSDDPSLRRTTNVYIPASFGGPADFTAVESATPLLGLTPTAPGGFFNPSPAGVTVTNDYSYVSYKPSGVPVDTNSVVGGNPTNMPGRMLISGGQSVNLANARIVGASYLNLNTPVNLVSYSNASIAAAYSDMNIGVPSGSLTLSNLMEPTLPVWSGVPGAPSAVFNSPMEGLQAWSGSFTFVDTNGVTNDVRVLLINSALRPTSPTIQKDIFLHAPVSLQINDVLNVFGKFGVDSTSLTIETNDNTAFSLVGALNLLSPEIFWSTSFTNLQYLTNWGVITTTNLANFAGNMFSPDSARAAATPYQAFVNHGFISDQGVFIDANYFENSGTIQEALHNGMDIRVSGPAFATNGIFTATNGPVSIAADSLFASNGVISAGQSLSMAMSCYLSDGYVFGNQFGHTTNATPVNVVTNGNFWTAGGGVRILAKPATGDLLGTTITNISMNGLDSFNQWAGQDRGCTPAGFATNLALGRMIFKSDVNPSHFTFATVSGNNALYVDSIELKGNATNTDVNGNFTAFTIQPGMKIYYAQALENGVSIAEKLNGKNGGGFCWVSNYAGVYSSTNLLYPDGKTYIYNEALVISPDLDSDGDLTVNRDDPTPIPAGLTFDISNIGPVPCGGSGSGGGTGNGDQGSNGTSGAGSQAPGTLSFPAGQSASASLSFSRAQGSYNGLFYETNGVTPTSSGFFTANVTGRGGFTAKLQLAGQNYSLSKSFDQFGHFKGSVSAKNGTSLNVDLQLVNNEQIIGEISSGTDWSAQLMADRAAFSSKHPAPVAWIGKNTLLLSTDAQHSSTAAGDSFGNVTVSKSGSVQWTGSLPDGTKVSQKSTISQNGIWPLYSAPYGGSGSFIGWMQVTNGDPGITGSAVWIVPSGNALYQSGLTNELNAAGSKLTGAGVSGQRTLILNGASISSTNSVMIYGKGGQNGTLKVSMNAKTGMFTGSMVDQDSHQTISFQGALLEKSGIGGGFFLNADKSQGGKVYLSPAN